jgi:predicted aldo/keto reductase-like oxidoreductase
MERVMSNNNSSYTKSSIFNSNHSAITRRRFLEVATAISAMCSVKAGLWAAEERNGIPYKSFGRTGEKISAIGLGGYHIGTLSDADSARIIRTAIDSGINFMDNCWDYNNGASEVKMGKALQDGYRKKVFLMTKIDGRDKKTAASQIDESLRRLQTDHVDLMQMHEVIRMNDPERTFSKGGAIEALMDGKKAGKIRFIGFTGHKSPDMHLHMIKTAEEHGVRLDAVLMPVNVMDAHFNSFVQKVMPVLVEKKIGIQTMKPMGGGIILKSGTVTAVECLRFAMSQPTDVVITGCESLERVQQALDTARNFKPMKQEEIVALLGKTAAAAAGGKFELYKTSTNFDGTTLNPQWLGS